jgi:hypothetical protein
MVFRESKHNTKLARRNAVAAEVIDVKRLRLFIVFAGSGGRVARRQHFRGAVLRKWYVSSL